MLKNRLTLLLLGSLTLACGGKNASQGSAPDGSPPLGPAIDGANPFDPVDADGTATSSDASALVDDGEPAGPPSSTQLIASDRESGIIDSKTAALYTSLAQMVPSRVPAKYRASSPVGGLPSVNSLVVMAAHLDEYTPAQAAAANAMLADPEDPAWMAFPAEFSQFADSPPSCLANYDGENGGGRFIGPKRDTKHFRIRALLPKLANVTDQNRINQRIDEALATNVPGVGGVGSVSFADYLDQIYDYYANTIKMQLPFDLPKVVANGGLIPIYVATCDGALNYAAAAPAGYIFVSVGMAFEEEKLRRVVIPHEIFHIFEYAYHLKLPDDKDWPIEASAVAVEDLVAPGIRRWDGSFATNPNIPPGALDPMDRMFQCPEEPLHESHHGPCRNRPDSSKHYAGDYSKFILLKFLMRNHGETLNLFWYELSEAGGDPSTIFDPNYLAEFQLALLGESPGKTAFDPADRAVFYKGDGKRSLDKAPGNPERYTLKVNPQKVAASNSYRFGPSDDLSASRALKTMNAESAPLSPGATHRLLIEIPDELAEKTDPAAAVRLALVARLKGCTKCTVNVTAVQPGKDGPGAVFDTSYASTQVNASATNASKIFYSTSVSEAQPRYVLAVISNWGDSPITWKAGFTLVAACEKACGDYYKNQRVGRSCPQSYCRDIKEEKQKQECIDTETSMTRFDAMFGWCPFLCFGGNTVAEPYPAQKNACNFDWQTDICNNGGVTSCADTPAGFVPIPQWPNVPCTEIKVSTNGKGETDCGF